MRLTTIAILYAVAACGGSKPAPTTVTTDPVAPTEPASPVDPVKPAEPEKPVEPDPAAIKASLLAGELAAFEKAKPVFERHCAKCHSKDGAKQNATKREHFEMTKYPFGGHHAMDVHNEIRKVLGVTGKKPTMPTNKPGVVKGEELDLVKAWADAFEASHKGGAHEGHDAHGGGHQH